MHNDMLKGQGLGLASVETRSVTILPSSKGGHETLAFPAWGQLRIRTRVVQARIIAGYPEQMYEYGDNALGAFLIGTTRPPHWCRFAFKREGKVCFPLLLRQASVNKRRSFLTCVLSGDFKNQSMDT